MNNDIEKIIKIGIGVIALLVVVSLAKLPPKNETITLDDYTPDITTENTTTQNSTTEHTTDTQENTVDYTTEDVQENNLIVPEGREDEFFADEITIPRNITVGEDGTVTVIEPITILDEDVDSRISTKESMLSDADVETINMYINKDGSLSIVFDSFNLEKYIKYIEYRINYTISRELYNKVSINKNYAECLIYVGDNTELLNFSIDVTKLLVCIRYADVYSNSENSCILIKAVYEKTNEVMYEFVFDGKGEISITGEEWNQKLEEMKENASATATDASATDVAY